MRHMITSRPTSYVVRRRLVTHVLVKKLQLALSQKWVRKAGVAAASLRRLLERPGPRRYSARVTPVVLSGLR